jgi:ankyrin repeat protein
MVKLLLSHRANPNEENLDRDTPLTLTLKRIHVKSAPYGSCALAVLDAGANVNAQNENGLAPLHYAAKHGMVKWVQLLLKRGADKTVKDTRGKTPYDVAKSNGKPQCATLLKLDPPQT